MSDQRLAEIFTYNYSSQMALADGSANDTDMSRDGVLRLLVDVGLVGPSSSGAVITTGSMRAMDIAALLLLLLLPLANSRLRKSCCRSRS